MAQFGQWHEWEVFGGHFSLVGNLPPITGKTDRRHIFSGCSGCLFCCFLLWILQLRPLCCDHEGKAMGIANKWTQNSDIVELLDQPWNYSLTNIFTCKIVKHTPPPHYHESRFLWFAAECTLIQGGDIQICGKYDPISNLLLFECMVTQFSSVGTFFLPILYLLPCQA